MCCLVAWYSACLAGNSMPDPDLEIREGGSHPGPEIRGGGVISQNIFSPFRPQFGLQNKGGLGPQTPPLDPPLKFITNRGWARILQRWGSHCVTPRVFSIGMSTSRPCFTKSDILLSDEQWAWGEGQAYKINNLRYVELNYQKLIRGCSTPYEFHIA